MKYTKPTSLDTALSLTRESDDFEFIAGGTDLMVRRVQGTRDSTALIDLGALPELRGITPTESGVSVGAGVTLDELSRSAELGRGWPAIVQAARSIASPVIRASATVAGNLLCENRCVYFDQSEFWREAVGYCLKCGGDVCIATGGTKSCYSVFVSDLAPVLICHGATVEIADARGLSELPVEALYTGDGTSPRAVSARAIVTRVLLQNSNQRTYFRKIRPRASVDFTNLTIAMSRRDSDLVIAASGIGPGPVTLRASASTPADQLAESLLKGSRAIDNLPYSRVYRRMMVGEMVKEGLMELG